MNRYITTTLPYVNADPHIGFALEILQADMLARYSRSIGDDVFFSTGTDEHGQKIFEKAQSEGKDIKEYTDHYAGRFKELKDLLDLSYDNFIRTTDTNHKEAAQKMWQLCDEAGDIYKKKYKGLYCVGDEAFMTEKDLVDGKCPNHPNMDIVEVEEENYFFALSKYEDRLLKQLEEEASVLPDWRRKELIAFVKEGLEDVSISRDKTKLSWGVPVPGDDSQVMYVWFDALTNYISTLGWPQESENFDSFWNSKDAQVLQFAGKDQMRFQSLIWQAMLMSAEIKNTDTVFYHGFINSGGQKMSKSLGNVLSPYELVEKYGREATRYLLLRHTHPTEDSDITMEKLDEWYTAGLVNGIGNLVARITKLAETHLESGVDVSRNQDLPEEYKKAFADFEFNKVIDYIWSRMAELDKKITDEEPFKVIKTEAENGKEMLDNYMKELYKIAELLEPIMPQTSEVIKIAVKENKKPENLFNRI